jgi:hypothetical protein
VNDVALELFSSFGSKSKEPTLTLAMLVKVVPGDVSVGTCSTRLKSTVDLAGKDAPVHVIVPVEPTAGVTQGENMPAPLVVAMETNVNPTGIGSVKVTLVAVSGPILMT